MTHPLRLWLKSNGFSRKAFASGLEMHDQTVARLMKGSAAVTTDVIKRVSAGTNFEVSEEDLFSAYIDARARFEASKDAGKSTKTTDMVVSCEEQG